MKQDNYLKSGAIMYFLWGLLHVIAGFLLVVPFFADGIEGLWGFYGFGLKPEDITPVLVAASHVALNFGFDLAGYGVLAIILSWFIWKSHMVVTSFWILVIMLGIADVAFVYAQMMPGYVSLAEGIPGPILYVLGTALCGYSLHINNKFKRGFL
jgi:hypothetical protein